ncbi:MAG: hypothetical protein EB100_07675 [Crocinitomicaceae bacterium]|nr:hypothetical protein [Crocinitomicaceae bacterium]
MELSGNELYNSRSDEVTLYRSLITFGEGTTSGLGLGFGTLSCEQDGLVTVQLQRLYLVFIISSVLASN